MMYLAGWKETLQVNKVHSCRPFKGRVSKDTRQQLRMAISLQKAARAISRASYVFG
jgi:hypothetical protein